LTTLGVARLRACKKAGITRHCESALIRAATARSVNYCLPVAKTALIVDGQPELADGCAQLLKEIGLESQLAYSVEDAIPLFRSHQPALVLSDIYFCNEGRDGFDLADYVRASDPRTSVILMSGYDATEEEKQARDAGATRFLHKPFKSEELLSVVISVLLEKGA
jgi:DNA-binding NtrC family response regulator